MPAAIKLNFYILIVGENFPRTFGVEDPVEPAVEIVHLRMLDTLVQPCGDWTKALGK